MLKNLWWYTRHATNASSCIRLYANFMHLAFAMRTARGRQALAKNQTSQLYALSVFGKKLQLRLRTQDLPMLHEIFVADQYTIPQLQLDNESVVIDAGAHIGLFSVFTAARFGVEELVCIEPSPMNYALLEANTRHLPKAKQLPVALSDQSGRAYFNTDGLGYNHRLQAEGTTIATINMQRLLDSAKGRRISLLKIDIEGGEERVFDAQELGWLDSVDAMLIELHANYSTVRLAERIAPYGFTINTLQGKDYLIYAFRTEVI